MNGKTGEKKTGKKKNKEIKLLKNHLCYQGVEAMKVIEI